MVGERGRLGRMLWAVGGAVATVLVLIVLGTWFPVSMSIVVAWGALVFLEHGLPDSPWRPQPWFFPVGFTIAFSGLGLLFGAGAGYGPREHVGLGVVIGIVSFVLGAGIAVIGQRRFSARAVQEEIERFRDENAAQSPRERD